MAVRFWRALSVSLGLAIIAYFLYRFGADKVWVDLRMIGWRFAAILALEAVVHLTNAGTWWHMFPSGTRRGCFARLFLVQLGAKAVNDITPGLPLGGEPLKAVLMKEQFALALTTATLLGAKLSQALAQVLFVVVGMAAASWSMKLERLPLRSLGVGFAVSAGGLVVFMVFQISGLLTPVAETLHRLRLPGRWVEKIGGAMASVDGHLRDLYRARPRDFVASVAVSLAGLCVGVVQVWLMLGWIGLQRSWLSSLAIESFSVLVSFISFAIPGALGVQEGGKLLIFSALGLPLSAGLSVGIAFRLNSLVSMAEGFAVLIALKPPRADETEAQVKYSCVP